MQFTISIITFKCLLLCLPIYYVSSWVVDDHGCRTPNRGVGRCIPVKECQPMVTFFNELTKPIPLYIERKLRKYTCGYEEGAVKVCCPKEPISIRLSKGTRLARLTDIASHRNFNLLPQECGYTGIPNKISYGEDAVLGEYPWMALLAYNTSKGPKFKCGGTIINDKYILTAAHCISNLKEPLLNVRVGEYNISTDVDCQIQDGGKEKCASPVQDLAIEEIIPHPQFNTDYDNVEGFNDIGLLRVSTINITAENVRPICLPTNEVKKPRSNYLIITGWGYTERESKINNVLQKVALPIIRRHQCQRYFRTLKISHNQICANGKSKDSCSGDSGGPLQIHTYLYDDIRAVQYGIISFGGAVCGAGKYPGVYTKVHPYMPWILESIRS